VKRPAFIYFFVGIVVLLIYGLLDPQHFPFPKCPFLTLTGLKCPGCGSQRAMHQIIHGDIASAFRLNPMFFPALLYALAGYGIAFFSPRSWPQIRDRWFSIGAAKVSLVVIFLFWIGRNLV
jgi:hypothetical protein